MNNFYFHLFCFVFLFFFRMEISATEKERNEEAKNMKSSFTIEKNHLYDIILGLKEDNKERKERVLFVEKESENLKKETLVTEKERNEEVKNMKSSFTIEKNHLYDIIIELKEDNKELKEDNKELKEDNKETKQRFSFLEKDTEIIKKEINERDKALLKKIEEVHKSVILIDEQKIVTNLISPNLLINNPLPVLLGSEEPEKIYERFLKGVLIYRPYPKSDEGLIELPIASLKNPLECTFDLSQCGDLGKYLSISTSYHKEKKEENGKKLEIWLALRYVVEKDISTTAGHLLEVFQNQWPENVPVGVFWTRGGSDSLTWYDYLTTENIDSLSNNNLYNHWRKSRAIFGNTMPPPYKLSIKACKHFSFSFGNV